MTAWLNLFLLVKNGGIDASDAARLADALWAGAAQIAHGQDLTPDQVRALVGDALPVAEQVAEKLFPQITPGIAVANVILSMAHRPTFQEEQQQMNGDTAQGGRGM